MIRRLFFCLTAVLILQSAGARGLPPGEAFVFVILEGEPLAGPTTPAGDGVRPAAVVIPLPTRKQQIAAQQAPVEAALVALGGRITGRFDTLLNALSVKIDASQLPSVRQIPGVIRVQPVHHYQRSLETSVPWISTPAAWSLSTGPFNGENMRIAIVDSGIDYLHADFGGKGDKNEFAQNNSKVIEPGTFPTARVIGGTDLVGDDYDSRGEDGSPTPVPDPDPLDTAANGHGTHVAGIAAGGGVLTNGVSYSGPYTSSLDFQQFQVAPGVAPRAKLLAYKVFGSSGSASSDIIITALERCLDPNRDGNFADHVDVVNLSLGGAFGIQDERDAESAATDRLVNQGVIVAIAAGNNGNTFYAVSSPGVSGRAITVANSFDDGVSFSSIRVTAPPAVAGDYAAVEGTFTAPLSTHGAVTAQVVATDPALACDALLNAAALRGKIALIDRGTCLFVKKVRAAQEAGALGVIVVNNVDGAPFEMGGSGDSSDIRIPGVMISQRDGVVLKGQLANGLTVTLDAFAGTAHPELADQLSDSSSRGPTGGQTHLKPDLSAPGTSIRSASAGGGGDSKLLSGTSMATPHVAGAAALMRQARPTWSVEDIKAALMNTTVPVKSGDGFQYPETRMGAGRIRVDAALRSSVVARADTTTGEVSVSFGAYETADPLSLSRGIKVVNRGALPVTLNVSANETMGNPGVTLTPSATSVSVPGRSEKVITLRLDVDPAKLPLKRDPTTPGLLGDKARYFLNEASGQVWFTNSTQQIHVPWHIAVRPNSKYRTTATRVGVPAGNLSSIALPTRGTTAHPAPLDSVFQLGFLATAPGSSTSDLVAAGAASDYAVTRDWSKAHVYFGFAAANKWGTPQYDLLGLEVEIDLDGDEQPEYILLNSTAGNLNSQDFDVNLANDALLTLVADVSQISDFFTASAPFNVLPPSVRDTAPFHNRVAIHSAAAKAVGLGAGKSRFQYRVTLTDSILGGQTDSGWITFDAAAPAIDATKYGLQNSPIFDEGGSTRVDINRSAATAAGFSTAFPPRALILHQHGVAGQQVEVVTLDLGTPDTDGDGLPDWWEMEHFGDLASNGAGDPDRDGKNNAAEFAAGTEPLETRMLAPLATTGTLRWVGSAGRNYTVERAASITAPFVPVLRGLPGVDGTNTVVDPILSGGTQTWFYRVRPE